MINVLFLLKKRMKKNLSLHSKPIVPVAGNEELMAMSEFIKT
jgi:hypothetical protein